MLIFFVMTLFRSAFSYFASNILCICRVQFIMIPDSKHSLTYELRNDSYSLTTLSVKDVSSLFLTSSIGAKESFEGPSLAIMMCS